MFNRYHAKPRFKKRAATMFFLMLGIMLMVLSGARSQTKAYDTTVAVTISEENRLYQSPSTSSEVVGIYYQSVFIKGDRVGDDWFHVILPENVLEVQPNFSGYMRMDDILLYDLLMERKEMPYFCPVGELTEDTDFLEAPGGAEILARVPRGVIIEILGTQSDWLHVRIGDTVGFVPKAHVMDTGEAAHLYYGPPSRGYLVPESAIDWYSQAMKVYALPDVPEKEDHALYGRSFAVFAKAGDWLQIRDREGGRARGFVRDIPGRIYWLKDMKVSGVRLASGDYTVGRELPPGLYSFSAPSGGHGSIETSGDTPLLYHAFESGGEPYTMYLTEGASVSIRGDGVLSPMDEKNALSEANGWRLDEGGRYLIGENLISPQGQNTVYVSVKPGEKIGYYALSTFDDEAGVGGRPQRVKILPEDEEYAITVSPGMFLELKNCSIRLDFGNG